MDMDMVQEMLAVSMHVRVVCLSSVQHSQILPDVDQARHTDLDVTASGQLPPGEMPSPSCM
jgi:hypothetical protein